LKRILNPLSPKFILYPTRIAFSLIVACTLIQVSLPVQARIHQSQIDTFYLRLYNYKFRSADSVLQQIISKESDQGFIDLLQITYKWWLVISGECNPSGIDPLLDKIDHSIAAIEKNNGSQKLNQDKLFQLIVMYSYKSRVHNLQHGRLSSFTAYNSSLDYFGQLVPCEKVSCDMYNFVAGMYYSLGGYMKEQYPSLYFLGFDDRYADRQKGYTLLSQGVQSENLQVQTESTYFFMKLYSDVENNPDAALKYSEMLIHKFPDNLVFRYNQLQLLKAQGSTERMEEEFLELEERAAKNPQLAEKQKIHFSEEFARLNH
jgi:hypothetical protein